MKRLCCPINLTAAAVAIFIALSNLTHAHPDTWLNLMVIALAIDVTICTIRAHT